MYARYDVQHIDINTSTESSYLKLSIGALVVCTLMGCLNIMKPTKEKQNYPHRSCSRHEGWYK